MIYLKQVNSADYLGRAGTRGQYSALGGTLSSPHRQDIPEQHPPSQLGQLEELAIAVAITRAK